MTFIVSLSLDNEALQGNEGLNETARILREVAERLEAEAKWTGTIKDINGNTVGSYGVS